MKIAFSVFYLLAAGQGFMMGLVPMKKIKLRALGFALSGLILIVSLQLLIYGLSYSMLIVHFPHLWGVSSVAFYLIAPLFYFVFKSKSVKKFRFSWSDLIHLFLPILFIIAKSPFFFRTAEDKRIVLEGIQEMTPSLSTNSLILSIVALTQLIAYAVASYRLIKKNDDKSNKEDMMLFRVIITYIIVFTIYKVSIFSGFGYYSLICHLCKVLMGISVYTVAYTFLVSTSSQKYRNSNLNMSFAASIKKGLNKLMIEEQVFRDNQLSLETLAAKLNCTTHELSQLINQHFEKGFSSFVNSYRVEYAKASIENNPSQKLWQIGLDAGFNNRITFTNAFKKELDCTPSEFRKSRLVD